MLLGIYTGLFFKCGVCCGDQIYNKVPNHVRDMTICLKGSVHSAFQYDVNCTGAAKAFGSNTGQARQLSGRH